MSFFYVWNIFLQKGPPPTHFSDPTCPKIWVFSFVVHDSDNMQEQKYFSWIGLMITHRLKKIWTKLSIGVKSYLKC